MSKVIRIKILSYKYSVQFKKFIFHSLMVIQLVFIRIIFEIYFFYKVDSHKFTIAENMLTHKKCARYTHKKLSAFFVFNNRSPLVFEKSHIKEKNSTTRVVRIKILPTIFNNFPLQKYQGINLILQLPFMVSCARYIFFQRCINHIYVHLSLSLAFTQLLEAKKNLIKTIAILRKRYIAKR